MLVWLFNKYILLCSFGRSIRVAGKKRDDGKTAERDGDNLIAQCSSLSPQRERRTAAGEDTFIPASRTP